MMTRRKKSNSRIPRAEMSHSTITLSIPTVIALILVPLIVAAGLIGTTWKMTDRLGSVKAAIVNNDDGVKLNGQQVPLGRQLSGGLIDSTSQTTDGRTISWELTDATKASEGLKDGSYAAVVTIPDSFSRNAMSFAANKGDLVKKATVDVRTSDSSPVTDTTIATITAQAAERSINKTLGSNYLDNIYIGFNKSADSMVSLGKGASQLDVGAAGLNSGIKQSTEGARQLSAGMNTLDTSGSQLSSAGTQMVAGVNQLASGVNALDTNGKKLAAGGTQLSSGASQMASGISELDKQLSAQTSSSGDTSQLDQLNTGMSGLKTGTAGIAQGLKQYQAVMQSYGNGTTAMPSEVGDGAQKQFVQQCMTASFQKQLSTATKTQTASLPSRDQVCNGLWSLLWNGIDTNGVTVPGIVHTSMQGGFQAGTTAAAQGLDQKDPETGLSLVAAAEKVSGGASDLQTGVSRLVTQLKALPTQMKQLQTGIHKLATASSQLSTGVSTYTSGVSQYTAGVHTLNQQMPTLSSGISQYASGVSQYTAGVSKAATGVSQFYDGQVKLSQGSTKYAEGVHTFATELAKGSKQVPTYSAGDREKLADAVTTPVNTETNPMGTSAWVVGLIVILGLWLGALAIWMAARTVPSRVLTSSKSSLQLLWSSLSTGALVTGISALGLAVIASLATDASAGRAVGLFLMLLLVGAMCLAVNHALAAWLHSIGRFISLAFFVVAAAVGLVSAVPAPVRWVHDISPLKPAMEGVTAILSGGSPSFGSLLTIILWLVIGGVASLLAVNRARHTSAAKVLAAVS